MIFWNRTAKLKHPEIPKWFRSLALISKSTEAQTEWLSLWDENRSCFDFVTAERSANQSFRDCLLVEICDSLGLTSRDVLISNMAQLNLEFAEPLPGEDAPTM